MRTRRRPALALAAALVVGIPLAWLPAPSAPVRCGKATMTSAGTWTSLALPSTLQILDRSAYQFAVDRVDPNRMYVSDGERIVRSADGGCSWKETFALDPSYSGDPTLTPGSHVILSIVTPDSPTAHQRVYVVVRDRVQEGSAPDARPHVFVSDDGATGWRVLPLPGVVGWVELFAVSPSQPSLIYFSSTPDEGDSPWGTVLYASTDAGETWEPRSLYPPTTGFEDTLTVRFRDGGCVAAGVCVGVPFASIAIDPLDGNHLWAAQSADEHGAVYESFDGGRHWHAVFPFSGFSALEPAEILVFHQPGSEARISIMTGAEGVHRFIWSTNGGASWHWQVFPEDFLNNVTSVAQGSTASDLMATVSVSPSEIAYRLRGTSWEPLVPPTSTDETVALAEANGDRAGGFTFLAAVSKKGAIVRMDLLRFRALRAAPDPGPCADGTHYGDWTYLPAPIYIGSLDNWTHGYAVDPLRPDRILVTDRKRVLRSQEGGCSWSYAFALPLTPPRQYPFDPELTEINAMAIPARGPDNGRAYLLLAETDQQGDFRPHVLRTEDDARTWLASDDGLPKKGTPLSLTISPSDPDTMYLLIGQGAETYTNSEDQRLAPSFLTSLVYGSTDGGRSWTRRALSRGVIGGVDVETGTGTLHAIVADPVEPRTVYAAAESGGLYRSGDGGRNWHGVLTGIQRPGVDIVALDVRHARGSPPIVLAENPTSGTVYRIEPDAGRWTETTTGEFQTLWRWSVSAAFGADADTALVGTWKGIYRPFPLSAADPADEFAPATSCDGKICTVGRPSTVWGDTSADNLIIQLTADRTAHPHFFGAAHDHTGVMRYEVRPHFTKRARFGKPIQRTAALTPSEIELWIPPGSSKSISYALAMSRRPQVDVYFLVDSSISMSGPLISLQRGLTRMVEQLRDGGVDAWFGVGEYRRYRCESDSGDQSFAYRRDLDVTPPGRPVADAIARLEGHGLSGAQLAALFQVATGLGQDAGVPGPSPADIPSGMQANWRPGSLRLIVHAADRYFNAPGRNADNINSDQNCVAQPWEGPGFVPVIAALRAKQIHQLGIAVKGGQTLEGQNGETKATVRDDLSRVARETGAIAGPGGVDCDGDGRADIAAGAPLVCEVEPSLAEDGWTLADAVVEMMKAVKQPATVRLREDGVSGVVSAIAPTVFPRLNLNGSIAAGTTVTYTCGLGSSGEHPVRLVAEVTGVPAAGASALIHCGRPPVAPVVRALKAIPPLLVEAPPIPPPGPQPGQQPQTQGQPQPHPAVAPEQQEQPQTAMVQVTNAIREQEGQLAFVDRRRRSPAGDPALPLALAGGAIAAAYGWLSVARARAQVRKARR